MPVYFYCTRNSAEPERSNPESILRCLARQLSSKGPQDPILEPSKMIYYSRKEENFRVLPLFIEESTRLIIELTKYWALTIIVIDAVDEANPQERFSLLESLSTIVKESANLVKVLLSSRNDRDIAEHLLDSPEIVVDAAKNKHDIDRFVHTEVDHIIAKKRLLHGHVDEYLRDQIVKTLSDKAQGMRVPSFHPFLNFLI